MLWLCKPTQNLDIMQIMKYNNSVYSNISPVVRDE